MKQIFQNLRNGETFIAEVPIPRPKAGQVLVRTAASLVSAGTERMVVEFAEKTLLGKARSRPDLVRQMLEKARRDGILTTLEAALNRLDQPMPLGYSSAGTIAAVGSGVREWRVGQRVACAGGGYAVHAEYGCIPSQLLAEIPDHVSFEAAAFTTLGAVAMHGFRLGETQLGEKVAVIGLGLLGQLTVGVALAAGCQVLGVDLDPQRVALAEKMGAQAVLRAQAEEAAQAFSRGRGCDAVLICADSSSSDPIELAGAIARDRARVVAVGAVGLNVPRKIYYEKELTLLNSRSYGPGRYDPVYEEEGRDYPIGYVRWTEGRNMEAFVDLLASDRLDVQPLISHRFPIESAPQAYELILGKKKGPFLGVLLTYPGAPGEALLSQPAVTQPQAAAVSQEKMQIIRLGVLGAGNFAATTMLPALRGVPRIQRETIVSASGSSARHAAQKFNFRSASSDESQVIGNPAVNTVLILTRHDQHARQAIASLEAGKHVFCEKPLAVTLAELEEIQETLETVPQKMAFQPLLMVGFNRRFAPLSVRLAGFLSRRREPLAMHYTVNAGFLPASHWINHPQQGGRIIGECCHFIDLMAFLAGDPPTTVSALGLPDLGRYHEDNAAMLFSFPDGSVGTISYLANGDRAYPKERLEVFCGGKIGVLNDFRTLELFSGGRRQILNSPLRQDKGHHAEWLAFSAAVIGGGPPPIPYDHLFGTSRAAILAVEALRCGERLTIDRFHI